MTDTGMNVEQDLIRGLKDFLRQPAKEMLKDRISNCQVRLSFKVDGMSDADLEKLFEAERLLESIGIKFDRGMGFGQRDWFLAGDLGNAWVRGENECTEKDQKEAN